MEWLLRLLMSLPSAKAIAVTRRVFLVTAAALSVEIGIGVALWSYPQSHGPVAVAGVTTYTFAAIFGILLAGVRWPVLGAFTQSHSSVVGAVILGSAAAILAYLAYPDPAMLIIGPFILGFFVLVGWVMRKIGLFGF